MHTHNAVMCVCVQTLFNKLSVFVEKPKKKLMNKWEL